MPKPIIPNSSSQAQPAKSGSAAAPQASGSLPNSGSLQSGGNSNQSRNPSYQGAPAGSAGKLNLSASAKPAVGQAGNRMDVQNHPQVLDGSVKLSSTDQKFQDLYNKRMVAPSHEAQDGKANSENRKELKDAGIKPQGENVDLQKLNIQRVLEKKGTLPGQSGSASGSASGSGANASNANSANTANKSAPNLVNQNKPGNLGK